MERIYTPTIHVHIRFVLIAPELCVFPRYNKKRRTSFQRCTQQQQQQQSTQKTLDCSARIR